MQLAGRRYFSIFEFINTLSFSFLAGNVLTLLLLQLGASDFDIGMLNSFVYLSFFFMPFGRKIVGKIGLVKNFSRSWTIRYLFMIPVGLIPLLFGSDPAVAIVLIFVGYLGFQIFRGIGIVSINPIVKTLSEGKDQGNFLSRLQILVHSGAIVANLGVALLVGTDAPLGRYSLSITAGILLGFVGARSFSLIPEPPGYRGSEKEISHGSLLAIFHEHGKNPSFRRFLVAFALMVFFSSMFRPFLPVFAKQYYQMADRTVLLFSLLGSFGAVVMGLINRVMMDRLGTKPMIMIFTGVVGFAAILSLLAPWASGVAAIVLLSGVFFFSFMGVSGSETASQGYYFAIMPPSSQLELGILYYLLMGVAGALGSVVGGGLLDWLKNLQFLDLGAAFSWFFAISLSGIVLTLSIMTRLERLTSRSVGEALSVLLSLRDWRAMSLVKRLEKSTTLDQEQKILQRLREIGSDITLDEVLQRLRSPLFRIRGEALNTLFYLTYNKKIEDALVYLVQNNEFATSYPAARILGQRGSARVIPILQKALDSSDPLLAGNAAAGLGELGHRESRVAIETRLLTTTDQHLLVYGSLALGMLGDRESIPVLYRIADRFEGNLPVVQEASFAIGIILGLEERIHRDYYDFIRDPGRGLVQLIETMAGNQADRILQEIQGLERTEFLQTYLSNPNASPELFEAARLLDKDRLMNQPAFVFLQYALLIKGFLG